MIAEKVPFKVVAKGCKDGRAMGHRTLRKMGLIQADAAAPSATSILRLGPSKAHSTSVKSTMMGLLHTLVCKVSKVLKNQKTLTSNQRKLAPSYNADHSEHLIDPASINSSDSNVEPEDEEAFDVPTPQFQEDPHSEDEDAAVRDISGGDEEEEEESGENDGEDEGRGQEDEEDDEDSEYQID